MSQQILSDQAIGGDYLVPTIQTTELANSSVTPAKVAGIGSTPGFLYFDGTGNAFTVKTPSSGGSQISITRNLTSGTKIGTITIDGTSYDLYCETDSDTTYGLATTSSAGLMSASDKAKLNNIDSYANDYSLPTATASKLGGIKVGKGLNIANGVLNITLDYAISRLTSDVVPGTSNSRVNLSLYKNHASAFDSPIGGGSGYIWVKPGHNALVLASAGPQALTDDGTNVAMGIAYSTSPSYSTSDTNLSEGIASVTKYAAFSRIFLMGFLPYNSTSTQYIKLFARVSTSGGARLRGGGTETMMAVILLD